MGKELGKDPRGSSDQRRGGSGTCRSTISWLKKDKRNRGKKGRQGPPAKDRGTPRGGKKAEHVLGKLTRNTKKERNLPSKQGGTKKKKRKRWGGRGR